MTESKINALVSPEGSLEILSAHEVSRLKDRSEGGLYRLFRQCALAVLNTGVETDDCKSLMEAHSDFDVRLVPQPRGLKLELINAPAHAFVDGQLLRAIREHLFSVLRDIVYTHSIPQTIAGFRRDNPEDITNLVSTSCAMLVYWNQAVSRTWRYAGAATPLARMNTSTARRLATSWACVA